MGAIVLFDGICNLCNGAVSFILDRDPGGYFQFASLQSEEAKPLLRRCGLPADALGSIVLVEGDTCRVRSAAVLRILRHLSWPWPILSVLVILPRPIRDAAYDLLAARRYRWFGKSESCRLPRPEERDRFLST